ncbi:MAG TPA: hypothetical protein VM077_05045 [Candidatus Limnocylindrales bacterium]|nr:hypothetical protein [Candidatus Limnocylindrales bacterium]
MVEQNNQGLFPLTWMGVEADLPRVALAALQSDLPIRVVARGGQKYSTPTTDALDTIFLPKVPQGQVRIEILFDPGKNNLAKVMEAMKGPKP